MKTHTRYIVFALVLMAVGCSANQTTHPSAGDTKESSDSKPIIAATNFAIQSIAKEIVGDFADVVRPQVQLSSERGLDADEVISMQKAALVLTNGPGADDAPWLNLISLNESRIVATTSEAFELSDFIQVEDYRTVHSHGDEGEHSHPWLVPHCWLDPRLAVAQSSSILNRLSEAFPDREATFAANHKSLIQELEQVEELVDSVAELIQTKNVTVIASDPRLLFFTRALKLDDNYLLWFELPEAPAAIDELEKRKPEGKQKLLLCAQDIGSLRKQLGEATVLRVDLIEQTENQPESAGKFIAMLRENYQTLKTCVEGMAD